MRIRRSMSSVARAEGADNVGRSVGLASRARWLMVVVLAVASLVSGVPRAVAAPQSQFTFSMQSLSQQDPVEQESPNYFFCGGSQGPVNCAFDPSTWVTNPTPNCAWDVDDSMVRQGSGVLGANTTATDSICLVADSYTNYGGDPHIVEMWVNSASPNLRVTVSNSEGVTWTATPTKSQKTYTYGVCVYDPTADSTRSFPTFPGSNGGTGVQVDYRLSVTNPGKTTVRDAVAYEQIRGTTPGSHAISCPDDSFWY